MKKALLINPAEQTVSVIEINDYKDIYKFIGNGCTCFSAPVSLDNDDTFYCDDEGLYHEIHGGIMMENWAYPIIGNIVVQGTDMETGDSIDVKTTPEELEKQIIWVSQEKCQAWADKFN
jgi:hypothetical protein